MGQYLLYRTILDTSGLSDDLYLAVPEMAFLGILGEELGRQIRLKTQMKILIFNPVAEEIIQWIA